jgi:hypothetical protein
MTFMRWTGTGALAALVPVVVAAQALPEFVSATGEHPPAGWHAFSDVGFLLNSALTLTLAAVLGLAMAYHPRTVRAADTLEELKAPKIYTMYSVIGAIIGIMVLEFGLVIGFVVFGIGGLIRFRTDLRSASVTGQVIFVTLIGLSCGLDLPHVAVLAAVFGYALTYVLDARLMFRIEIQNMHPDRVAAAAVAYRALLEQRGCRILSEKKSAGKGRITFIFRAGRGVTRHDLELAFESSVEPTLRGTIDWEVD